jgi:acetate kinase
MTAVLVINSGSSSIKYQLIDVQSNTELIGGTLERVTDHVHSLKELLPDLRASKNFFEPEVIGHRVVHGGERFSEPTLITPDVISEIESLIPLAPLHNPGNLAGIKACLNAFPETPQVAVFDTAFHQSMPPSSFRFAIDDAVASEHGLRKYGFHGTSFSFVTKATAEFLGKEVEDTNLIILHIGNGASACAVKKGQSFDTSMGLSPLPGLVMGTRSGDIDPTVIFYLNREAGMSVQQIDELLNKHSGLLGMAGSSDMRDVVTKSASDPVALEALEVYAQRIRFYLGGYYSLLGEVDAVVLTAGVGENSVGFRELLFQSKPLGINLDSELNQLSNSGPRVISSDSSSIPLLVVPTNEELEIAKQSVWGSNKETRG